MILCDTNILIEFYKDNADVKAFIKSIGVSDLAVSIVTVGELYFGARDKRELGKIRNHLALLKQVPLDAESSQLFLSLIEKYVLSHRLSVPDALIAATAICQGLPLYTFNVKDFNYIPGLELYKP
ncbi:MAG: type II toxin-antitoxin system VapC family toxin [Chloroflexi bacterium]|nr:type II toxin-antitoxin system VapC family toxin [Chloroflexota bacterium]